MDTKALLLSIAFHHRINAPNIETAFEQFNTLAGQALRLDAFCDAVADCLRERLIREPLRLPQGALQCHWQLELTPAGVAAARNILSRKLAD